MGNVYEGGHVLILLYFERLEMFVNKVCMPGDVYEGRCYPGPPTGGQALIQVLAPASWWGMFTREALSSFFFTLHAWKCL